MQESPYSSIKYEAVKTMLQQRCYVDVYTDIYAFQDHALKTCDGIADSHK